jgi:hypothetical protein
MKRFLAVALLLAAPALTAGMTYQFRTSTTGLPGAPQLLSGSALVEGRNARVTFSKGDGTLFRDGAVALSRDGGQNLLVLDPTARTYYEVNPEKVFGTLRAMAKSGGGALDIAFRNPKISAADNGNGGLLEGYATRKSTVTTSYDLVIDVMGQSLVSHIEMTAETWTTDKLPADLVAFIQLAGLKTGIESLDKLIDTTARATKGFPLKQVTRTRSTIGNEKIDSVSTTTITAIRQVKIAAEPFAVPAGYRKVAPPMMLGR